MFFELIIHYRTREDRVKLVYSNSRTRFDRMHLRVHLRYARVNFGPVRVETVYINGLISPFTGCAHALSRARSSLRVFVTSVLKTPRVLKKERKKNRKFAKTEIGRRNICVCHGLL